MVMDKRLKVGVTLYVRNGQQSLWENGIFQNCFFLILLLQCSPAVEKVYLVNGGDGRPDEAQDFLKLAPAPVIDLSTAREKLDVVIELSAQLDAEWARSFRGRGGVVIGMRVANDYVIDIERMMFGKPHGMLVSDVPYSEIWTLPAFEHTCAGYYETALRAPVYVMPHLWSPMLIERTSEQQARRPFGYEPGRTRWRLAILEPNLCMVKVCHLPMLIADLAHRQAPHMTEALRVFNSLSLKENPHFNQFARSLDLVRHGIATFEARYPIYEIMTQHADAIVSHQWENAQNYLYYEALYGGYPLVHNSSLLGGCGYRYDGFDCEAGALALRQAFIEHDARSKDYKRAAREFLATLDPQCPANVACFTAALARAWARTDVENCQ